MEVTWADSLAAWSELATAILTGFLLVAASFAGYFAYGQMKAVERQIGIQEKSHREEIDAQGSAHSEQIGELRKSREISLRPFVHPAGAKINDSGVGRVWFTNIGPGPALSIRVDAWVAEVKGRLDDPAILNAAAAILELRAASDPPDFEFHLGGLGPNTTSVRSLDVDREWTSSQGAALYKITYVDIFDQRYPQGTDIPQFLGAVRRSNDLSQP